MKALIIILLCITNLSCNKKQSETKKRIETKVQTNNNDSGLQNVKILKTLFITNENGLNFRDSPNGRVLGKLAYGQKVGVIEYSGIENEIEDEGKIIKAEWYGIKNYKNDETNKVYVFSSFLGDESKVKLIEESLSVVQGLYSSSSKAFFWESGKEVNVDSLLKFEIISKQSFDQLKTKNIDYINKDKTHVYRVKDTLFVGNHKFVDDDIDNEGYIKHKYIGEIDFLNKYVIFRNLWENADYILIDKSSGNIESENTKLIKLAQEQGVNRLGLPRISINKKNMITLEGSIYTKKAELNIFEIVNNSNLRLKHSLLFKTWSPKEDEIYWISDNEFIVNASPINVISEWEYGKTIGSNNYLKIKILNF